MSRPILPQDKAHSESRKLFVATFLSTLVAGLLVQTGGKIFLATSSFFVTALTVALVSSVLLVGQYLFYPRENLSQLRLAFTSGEMTMIASVLVHTMTHPVGLVKVVFTGIVAGVIMYAYGDFNKQYEYLKDTDEWKSKSDHT